MPWNIEFADEFDAEFDELPLVAQDKLLARLEVLGRVGPGLGRPYVDTLNGSRHKHMKELRFDAAGKVWRVAFAFDPDSTAIVLVAGDKTGAKKKRFYKELIGIADARYAAHLFKKARNNGPKSE